MKTTIVFKDNHEEIIDDSMPTFSPDSGTMTIMDRDNDILGNDVPLNLITKVIYESEGDDWK